MNTLLKIKQPVATWRFASGPRLLDSIRCRIHAV
jgi:hypothetical protein